MLLKLPASLQYPITITKIHKQAGQPVDQDETLFDYTFKVKVVWGSRDGEEDQIREETHGSKFECPVEGKLTLWKVWEKDVIKGPQEVAEVEEPCRHDVQVNGMCVVCGKDMTLYGSYNSDTTDAERAPIQMSHETQSLTISKEEASRVEEAAKRRLLASRKLSLVVDLDQTIIHAAVDPTINEWKRNPENPNFEALQDVKQFQLKDDGPGMRGCWYYIKLRPGLKDFLEKISKLYELHIYTMGTRQYAQKIADIIDGDRKYFGDRILSRDESGSMTAKSLQRLFPVDTKMVVIIDDRGDVWKWNDNLVKVAPFDFFVGIGDINSSFLQKKQEIQSGDDNDSKSAAPTDDGTPMDVTRGASGTDATGQNSALEQLVAMGGGDDPTVREMQTNDQEAAIASQVADKPLLQMQKKLDEEDEKAAAAEEEASSASSSESQESLTPSTNPTQPTMNGNDSPNGHPDAMTTDPVHAPSSAPPTLTKTPSTTEHQRHPLLHNDDRELVYLGKALSTVHQAFYSEYDRRRLSNKGGRVATLAGKRKVPLPSYDSNESPNDLILVPDIKNVMPAMKRKILDGVFIVFSGVLPLHADVLTADITMWTRTFGATVDLEINKRTTHLVAARHGTTKVKQAMRRKNIKLVQVKWLFRCFSEWRRLDEDDYLLDTSDGKSASQTSKLKDEDDEFFHVGLSSSEDDSDPDDSRNGDMDTESETNSRSESGVARKTKKPRLNMDIPEDADTDGDEEGDPQSLSPLELDDSERNDIDQELKDFLGSDADTDSETESVISTNSQNGRSLPTRKRKRNADSQDTGYNTDPEDLSDPLLTSKVARTSGLQNFVRTAAASAKNFETVPAAVLESRVPDNEDIIEEQEKQEKYEREEEAEEEDSDDELARELERELEDDDDFDESGGGDHADDGGFMGTGDVINDIEEDPKDQTRQIDGWEQDVE